MPIRRTLALLAVVAAQAAASCASTSSARREELAPGFDDALRQARDDAATEAGRAWEQQNVAWFGPRAEAHVKRCGADAPEGGGQRLTLLLRIDGGGTITNALVRPETAYARCVRNAVAGLQFPEPAFPGYWLEIDMPGAPPGR